MYTVSDCFLVMPPSPQEEEHTASCSCCEESEFAEGITCGQDLSMENFLEGVGCSVYLELFTHNKVD